MDLHWRTAKNDHPQGKPKVFLSCGGADFKRYSEKIFRQLFDACNCAVYFYPAGAKITPDDDYRFNLNRMDLLVVPVTAELLCKPNRTMDFDVPYAMSRNIPILPLLQEEGLTELFNQRFGAIQFLCEVADDRTAIPYEEKLKTFLDGVLADDSLAQRVRDAFCARIFLSYRKKDRAYAQTLMSLIHQDPQLRNVAIWYDEFLIPGDNFERNIRQELQGSDLFLMAVTPNLLEPANYVMRTEYPAAQNLLPIVPAELVATDHAQLQACYPGIADPVDAYDQEKRTQILEDCLKSKLQPKLTPEQTYLLGIAYLRGIDVEKDAQKAVELLQEAADAGFADAAHRLAKIYHMGDQVSRNYAEATRWLERLISLTGDRLATDGGEEAALDHYWALFTAGSVSEQNLDERAAVEYYRKAIPLAQLLCDSYGYDKKWLADIHRCVARSYVDAERHDKALPYQKIATDIARKRYDAAPTAEKSRYFADCCCEMAGCYQELDALTEAVEYYAQATQILQFLLRIQKAPELVREMVELYENLGDILRTLGDKKRRRFYDKEADKLLKQHRKEMENGGESAWGTIARYCMKRGQYRVAIKMMEKVVELSRQRVQEDTTMENRRLLALNAAILGTIWEAANRPKKAEVYYRESIAISEEMVEEYPNSQLQLDLVEAYTGLADLFDKTFLFDPEDVLYSDYTLPRRDRPAVEEAYRWYRKALQLLERTAGEADQATWKQRMEIFDALGRLSKALGRKDEALAHYREYGGLACDLYESNPTDINQDRYADACFKLALLTLDADLMIEARDCWQTLAAAYPGNRTYEKRRKEAQRLLDA